MKTIKQIADEIGVTKQAVSRRVAQLPPTEVTTNSRGVKMISVDGYRLLRLMFEPQPPTEPPTVTTNQPPTNAAELAVIDILREELAAKNAQPTPANTN